MKITIDTSLKKIGAQIEAAIASTVEAGDVARMMNVRFFGGAPAKAWEGLLVKVVELDVPEVGGRKKHHLTPLVARPDGHGFELIKWGGDLMDLVPAVDPNAIKVGDYVRMTKGVAITGKEFGVVTGLAVTAPENTLLSSSKRTGLYAVELHKTARGTTPEGRRNTWYAEEVEKVERPAPKPEPKFKAGDRVVVITGPDYDSRRHSEALLRGTRARVEKMVDEKTVRLVDDTSNARYLRFARHRDLHVDSVRVLSPLEAANRPGLYSNIIPPAFFKVGDKVVLKEDAGDGSSTMKVGEVGIVSEIGEWQAIEKAYLVTIEHGDRILRKTKRYERRFEKAPVEAEGPKATETALAKGDRVKLLNPYNSLDTVGALATVTRGEYWDYGTAYVRVQYDSGREVSRRADRFEKVTKAQIVPEAKGVKAWVTGDSDDWSHGFEVGTKVTILRDDVVLDGSYLVCSKDGSESFVGANDLSIDAPRACFGSCAGCK